jgi:transcriptional regulator with XRE-family HTH domain
MSLPARLKETRELADISQRDLGKLAGLSETYPALIESGRRPDPGSDVVGRLAQVLGTTTDYLILGVGSPPTEEEAKASVEAARAARVGDEDSKPSDPEPQAGAAE